MQLAQGIAGARQVPSGVLDRIVAHADGVPLFLEELTKTVLQTSDLGGKREGTLQNVHVPETLQDALMARLDRLGRWKEIAQIGALIGPRFSFKMLTALVPREEEVAVALQHLLAVGLIRSDGSPPDAVYTFKHALLQDVAVASLLRSRRESLHIRIARTLESEFPQTALAEPELLAWHYSSAGLVEPAVGCLLSAAERAMGRSANIEAIDLLRKGLELLKTLPDSPERDRRELALQTHLGAALTAAKGFAAPAVRDAYLRARSLCARIEDPSQVFPVLRGLWVYSLVRAEWRQAQDLSEQMLELGERKNDVGDQLEGHRALGMTLLWRGELRRAREHFELGYNAYDPEQHHRHAVAYGNDPGVACLAHGGYVLSVLGHFEQALAHGKKARALARRRAHPFSLVQALIYCAFIHHTRREPQQVLKLAKESMRLASEHGFPFWLAEARMMEGWARCEQGAAHAGLAQLQRGFTEFLDTGALMDRPRWLSVLAEAHAKCNQPDAGLRALTQGLILVDETGERFYEARLLGLQGDILLLRGGANAENDAETAYLKSLEVARQQGAKAWELRTATSLTRLWGLQGRTREGVDLLASLYGSFGEGFDTPDLVDAKVLLEGLQ
jgi:predicted ATPase